MDQLLCMVTGHRPNKIGGYVRPNPVAAQIESNLRIVLRTLLAQHPGLVGISGMALGVDQMYAETCLELGVPVHAYVPFQGQERIWPASSQQHYRDLLSRAEIVKTGADELPASRGQVTALLMARNSSMVAACHAAIAIWDGSMSGTGDAVNKLRAASKPVLVLHPAFPVIQAELDQWALSLRGGY